MFKKISITAAQLALTNAKTCDQFHGFTNTPFIDSLHIGVRGDALIENGNTLVTVN